jgi:hypothetical protein
MMNAAVELRPWHRDDGGGIPSEQLRKRDPRESAADATEKVASGVKWKCVHGAFHVCFSWFLVSSGSGEEHPTRMNSPGAPSAPF